MNNAPSIHNDDRPEMRWEVVFWTEEGDGDAHGWDIVVTANTEEDAIAEARRREPRWAADSDWTTARQL